MGPIKNLKTVLSKWGRGPKRRPYLSTKAESGRGLVEDLRKARVTALCMGPILTVAGLILASVTLGARPVREWSSTGAIVMLVMCACWTAAGIAMIVWAWRWTPEAWAQLVQKRIERKQKRAGDGRPEAASRRDSRRRGAKGP